MLIGDEEVLVVTAISFESLMTLLLESCQLGPKGSIFSKYLINISRSITQRSGSTLRVRIHPFCESQITVMIAALLHEGRFALIP